MKPLLQLPENFLTDLGVVDWGYTDELAATSYQRFLEWLPQNADVLPYLHVDKNIEYRRSLSSYWPEARSAIVFLFSYLPTKKALMDANFTQLAGYTLGFEGADYHPVLKQRLLTIAAELKKHVPFEAKISLDTQSILERDLAYRAGLGWIGKNSMLIGRDHGSYFILGSLLFDRQLELSPGTPTPDHCGTCTACVTACPTAAIDATTRTLRVKDCIAAWTIEIRDTKIPAPAGTETGVTQYFGCDICQDICPWNAKPLAAIQPKLSDRAKHWVRFFSQAPEKILSDFSELTNRGFLRFFEGTSYGRPGKSAFVRNIVFWLKRS